jgi:diaminopimelate epimerase
LKEVSIPFVKYQGTGNDFIIIDQRKTRYIEKGEKDKISLLCDRRFGIGADGLMLIESSELYSFEMVYFNADGNESTMCGNGGRCIAHYAVKLGVFKEKTTFWAVDGEHQVVVNGKEVSLKMCDVKELQQIGPDIFTLFTGSPHYVVKTESIPEDVKGEGQKIRYSEPYYNDGINVNFVVFDKNSNVAMVATYERGVEEETLSCGTGVTAAALVCHRLTDCNSPVDVHTKGGNLKVSFLPQGEGYSDIWLTGPATFVYAGKIRYKHLN